MCSRGRACLSLLPSIFLRCGVSSGVLLAQRGCELVQVLLRFLWTVEECFEEVSLRGHQGFRPHGHGLDVFPECCVLFKSVLDGVVENRDGLLLHPGIFDCRQASPLLVVRVLEWQPPWPQRRHFLSSLMRLARTVSVFCERLWEITVVCCMWSCIMCREVVTRSSENCSGFCAGEPVAEELSHPSLCFVEFSNCSWALAVCLALVYRLGPSKVFRPFRFPLKGTWLVSGRATGFHNGFVVRLCAHCSLRLVIPTHIPQVHVSSAVFLFSTEKTQA